MVPLASLLVPTLVAAIAVFVASAIAHMLLPWHRHDFGRVPDEDRLMDAMRPFAIPPGDYMVPCPGGPADMKNPAFLAKLEKGPKAIMTVMPPGMPGMGKQLAQWFVYCFLVGFFAAYVTSRALPPAADQMNIFRFTATIAFIGYVVANWQNSIWYLRPWATSFRNTVDGLVYAALTGAAFAWLWPGA
jgi:hypothetical protein